MRFYGSQYVGCDGTSISFDDGLVSPRHVRTQWLGEAELSQQSLPRRQSHMAEISALSLKESLLWQGRMEERYRLNPEVADFNVIC